MSDTTTATAAPTTGFLHEAVVYADDDEFLDGTLQFLRDGFEAGEPALVVVSRAKIRALRGELHGDGPRLSFADMDVVGHNPACIIPTWSRFVARAGHTATRVRGVGEPVSPERSAAELAECEIHERLLNVAFAGVDFWLRCPYDATRLTDDVIASVHDTHDSVVRDRVSEAIELDRAHLLAPLTAELPPPPSDAAVHELDHLGDDNCTARLRELVACHARDLGLAPAAVDDFVLAVHEITTNSVLYGGNTGVVRVWRDGPSLICEVQDAGHIVDPLVGRRLPPVEAIGGRGIWLANHLADLVQIRTYYDGTTVRVVARVP